MSTPEELAAQAAAKEAQVAADAEAAQAAAEAERLAAEQAAKDNLSADELKALNEKLLKQKRDANKEAAAERKRAEAAEAKNKKHEDAQKTAAELLEARVKEAEEVAATERARSTFLERTGFASDAGVIGAYREYAVSQLNEALKKDPDTNPEEFFKGFKESHPAMFPTNGKPAGPTAKGGPGSPSTPKKYDTEIADHKEALKTERDPRQITALKRSLRFMESEQAKEKGA